MKREYYAIYNYGMGSLLALVTARSKEEITSRYPMFEVYETRPVGVSDEDEARFRLTSAFDIGGRQSFDPNHSLNPIS